MYLSKQNGWYDSGHGDVYVTANKRYADDDPAVAALPSIFDKISDDAPPKSKVQAAVAAAKGKAAADG